MIRKSTVYDKEIIKELMYTCFGDKNNLEPYENLNDRYYLYFKNNILVAMTGLTDNTDYRGLEIDWTCTHPKYRHNGYMQELFKNMICDINSNIYCSCWRLNNRDKINLHTIMMLYNFEEIVRPIVHWKVGHNCFRNYDGGCLCYRGPACECYEDLYLRKVGYYGKNI